MSNQQQIIEAIADGLTLPPADMDLEASFKDDMGLNPVEVADLFDSLSRKFNIIVDPSETGQVKTIGDLVELIEDKLLE
ncbi:hypothetical protein A3A14_02155 [Candidatus Daviesbacteria bacterium RIFCSPLOWO2_01_FULL_43_38]|uniref:Carrier domain-containing protein n=2 Tax=Candidatus Daviesiibacteriota TaxID=1752718 RepID=A0A1F5K2E2_9BACT|nr:MAG: Acyl carrier protein [Candidatus Daviesbacteria bacterium GW2011_GWA2_42_7]OGE20457.1 MAG: hypothetical protein A2874_00040 [Candidatus Daviesbacteria bacterium RIFCSPHIGHO2_01_FULL_43_17]OGE35005.1 MAG: hypothetical protein A3E45_01620 [Candidatus Daviesbacteria bacterium RIFCSPHIGHO2_12_FULL_43_11]OGE63269.1 MAG: hypothetical protein A3A14_02155 [Candidatus Daviesbacteria bacterium RIFCSPLOWO2_01_FULL_43_38]OGE69031.1 MAG: hypothetical protein A3J21_00775 [Candidatus Daviesbacteria ba